METKHLPRKPGVYQIVNSVNGKSYVGSTADLQPRAHEHRRLLRIGKHHSAALQSAWRKYGADALQVSVLEIVEDISALIPREQYWIDTLGTYVNGYNCCATAGSVLGYRYTLEQLAETRKRYRKPVAGFITPEGAEATVIDPRGFKDSLDMPDSAFSALQRGVVVSYKGWSHVNAKVGLKDKIKVWNGFIDPNGKKLPPVTNLRAFCREHGLDSSCMTKVHNGKGGSHKGYTHEQHPRKPPTAKRWRTYHGFINSVGEQQPIKNLLKFCRDNGMDHATMYKLIQGNTYHKSHKGWTYDPSLERQDYSWK